ncbi:MAG: homocysteine S-methyltransferase family protein [Desulfovibrio sp.]|nr:homocysteine S-methyltransferase family protein [Desulfovibrio sp.]
MDNFRRRLAQGARLLFDGAMGTMLQVRGLSPGQNPELFCLERPDILRAVHAEYIRAGADVITTSTFGGTRFKLPPGIEAREFNRRMAGEARRVVEECGRRVFVAGSVGPTGKFLRPLGELSFTEMVEAFREQIRGLLEGGADLVLAETHFDIAEARAVAVAARREGNPPLGLSMTYEDGRTLTGSTVAVCAATLANLGADLIAMNCGQGPLEMRGAALELLRLSPVPVLIQPNAGLPRLEGGETVFPLGPEEFASPTADFAREDFHGGAQCLGGCCGTTPAHIAALGKIFRSLPPPGPRPAQAGITLTSRSGLTRIGFGQPLRIIGERINPTGKKQLSAELKDGVFTTALRFADEQAQGGAAALDVNVGAPMIDETLCLPALVEALQTRVALPLSVDSTNMLAVEKVLRVYPASPLVNSISGEEGRLEFLGPLCRDFGAPFILLPLRGKKLPVLAKERIAILEELLGRMDALGVPRFLAIVDALVLAASSSPEAGGECLKFIRYCTHTLRMPVLCGLSNISFGLPARELLNSSFLGLAAGAGMNACIANPSNPRIRETVDSVNLLFGHDPGAENFIRAYAGREADAVKIAPSPEAKRPLPPCSELAAAVIEGMSEGIEDLVQKALDAGEDPFAIVREKLIPALDVVGRRYERKEYFLPQLIRSAQAMQRAFGVLKPLLEKASGGTERPVVVMATVEGDIHDIGKNIVSLMLGNHGFEVVDLGKDVEAGRIVEEARARNASLIGLSALMTTTMVRMRDTVELVEENGMPQKVMVGGAVVTEEFARSIGAHYAPDAVAAVHLAESLLSDTGSLPAGDESVSVESETFNPPRRRGRH